MGKKTDMESLHLLNHSKCMLAAFQNFRQDETMLDVTLVCKGMKLKAHKLVLSACSPLFKDIISENPCKHPIIILKDFEFSDLKAVIDFIYKGELSVPRERLMSALKVAEELNIRGLRRSESDREKYEKLYNQVRGKLSNRKKRKRYCHDSSDSEEKTHTVSNSDNNLFGSDLSARDESSLKSQPMEVESVDVESNSTNDKDIRPVVLRVSDPSANKSESSQITANEDTCSTPFSASENYLLGSQEEVDTCQKNEMDDQTIKSASELAEPYLVYPEDSASFEYIQKHEQNNFEGQNREATPVAECSENVSFPSCLSSESQEVGKEEEPMIQDSGKCFTCSKCDVSFTSRIIFMRHKMQDHNNPEDEYLHKCEHCDFAATDPEYFENHMQTHSDKVPYKSILHPKEFPTEEIFEEHLFRAEDKKISPHSLTVTSETASFPTENKNVEEITEFRCSICFSKFASRLRCQFHEKSCQGGS